MKVTKRFTFEYAHVLPLHKGKCRNLHGHNAVLDVTVEGDVNSETGMVIDFGDLAKTVNGVLENYDHALICGVNDDARLLQLVSETGWKVVELEASQATAEELLYVLTDAICKALGYAGFNALKVSTRLYETPNSWVELS